MVLNILISTLIAAILTIMLAVIVDGHYNAVCRAAGGARIQRLQYDGNGQLASLTICLSPDGRVLY